MKNFSDVFAVKREIDSYVLHFTGAPLLVGIDRKQDYITLLDMIKVDFAKQIIFTSQVCETEFPPNPAFHVTSVGNAAKSKPVIWLGASQSIMLYGQKATESFFLTLAGSSLGGPVIVLCPYCNGILRNLNHDYPKLGYYFITFSSSESDVPEISVYAEGTSAEIKHVAKGIKALLRVLEEGSYGSNIDVVTSCQFSYLSSSMFPTVKGLSPYRILCKMEPVISAGINEDNGTDDEWQLLTQDYQKAGSLSELCEKRLCEVSQLSRHFTEYLQGSDEDRFLCFVSLKVFYGNENDYLSVCLQKSNTADDLIPRIYDTILDFDYDHPMFPAYLRQRVRIIQSLDDNSALMKDFCARATIKGKDILRYLNDETEEERAAIIHALCCYHYSEDELNDILRTVSPQLALYLEKFTFDQFNTRVMESDVEVRDFLTVYFHRYKIQKITNRLDEDFLEIVEDEAEQRNFMKLQTRSVIIKKQDKKDVKPYFFDALGVEFLSYIRSKAEEYGMQFDCLIGHCNLPSITSKNKEFYDAFPEGIIQKEERLDEIKHHGTKFDYELIREPLHIYSELGVLDNDLKKMGSALAAGLYKKIVIMSDHGASRLAVTYQKENDKIALSEPGQHSGRCCPADCDPQIPQVYYEDGFAVLANYQRFKGSRKADVETHGGATLEETIVPVITLTLKPKKQQLFFVDNVILCSPKDGSSIHLFANPPLKKPRMMVGDVSYDGQFEGDQHNIIFKMPDIRRKGHHEAVIYDGGIKLETLTFETKRQTSSNDLI